MSVLEDREKLDNIINDIRIHLDKYENEIRNKACKEIFLKFIKIFSSLKPIKNKDFIKVNKFNDDKLGCILIEYKMNHIKFLTKIKKNLLKENWYKALENLSELDRAYDLLDIKIYYSIIYLL